LRRLRYYAAQAARSPEPEPEYGFFGRDLAGIYHQLGNIDYMLKNFEEAEVFYQNALRPGRQQPRGKAALLCCGESAIKVQPVPNLPGPRSVFAERDGPILRGPESHPA
jgi:hypothetical protein